MRDGIDGWKCTAGVPSHRVFAWVIPSGFGTHRIGLWSTADRLNGRSIESCYQDLMDHPLWKDRFENTQEIARYCGPVPSGMVKHTVKDRVMLLGDAAGMAKPTTGGGIGPGFHQIQCIHEALAAAVNANQLSEKDLKAITKQPWSAMKKEQDRARTLRNLLVSDCTDEVLDKHFINFAHPDTLSLDQRHRGHRKTRSVGYGSPQASSRVPPTCAQGGCSVVAFVRCAHEAAH